MALAEIIGVWFSRAFMAGVIIAVALLGLAVFVIAAVVELVVGLFWLPFGRGPR